MKIYLFFIAAIIGSHQSAHAMLSDQEFNELTGEALIATINNGKLYELFNLTKNASTQTIYDKRISLRDRSRSIQNRLEHHYYKNDQKSVEISTACDEARSFYWTLIGTLEEAYPNKLKACEVDLNANPSLRNEIECSQIVEKVLVACIEKIEKQ
jgi:hypothetical protein